MVIKSYVVEPILLFDLFLSSYWLVNVNQVVKNLSFSFPFLFRPFTQSPFQFYITFKNRQLLLALLNSYSKKSLVISMELFALLALILGVVFSLSKKGRTIKTLDEF